MSSKQRMSIRPTHGVGENSTKLSSELFKKKLIQLTEGTINSLQEIMTTAGYDEAECQEIMGEFLNKMKISYASELAAENQILEHAKLQVSKKRSCAS